MGSHIKLSMTQCHLTPRVTTKPSDTSFYRTDEIDLKTILISLLDYVSIIQEAYWGNFGNNLTLTYPGDGSCSILGIVGRGGRSCSGSESERDRCCGKGF